MLKKKKNSNSFRDIDLIVFFRWNLGCEGMLDQITDARVVDLDKGKQILGYKTNQGLELPKI